MKEAKRNNGREERAPNECPHCGAGADGVTVGLFWDFGDHCWRCVTCGFRVYGHALQPRTQAEIVAERIWDDLLDALDREESNLKIANSNTQTGGDKVTI